MFASGTAAPGGHPRRARRPLLAPARPAGARNSSPDVCGGRPCGAALESAPGHAELPDDSDDAGGGGFAADGGGNPLAPS